MKIDPRIFSDGVPMPRAPRLFPVRSGDMWPEPECVQCGRVCAVGARYDTPEEYAANTRMCRECFKKANPPQEEKPNLNHDNVCIGYVAGSVISNESKNTIPAQYPLSIDTPLIGGVTELKPGDRVYIRSNPYAGTEEQRHKTAIWRRFESYVGRSGTVGNCRKKKRGGPPYISVRIAGQEFGVNPFFRPENLEKQ